MQRTLLLAIAFSFALGGLCQSRIAILGGIHQSTVLESNNGGNVANTGYKPRTGAHFGFVADLPFHPGSSFSFQPGVIFYNKGRKFQLSKDSALVYMNSSGGDSVVATPYFEDRRTFLNYIDIPLNLVYRFPIGKNAKLMIGAGPYLSFFYNGTDNSERVLAGVSNESEEIKDLPVGDKPGSYQVLNYGVNGLAGIEFKRVFITANYSRGLNDFYTATYPGGFKHQVIGGTLGIYLGKVTPPTPKIKDRDKDGVTDDLDACPDEAGPALTNGCPDTDGDGIADREDKCPGTPGVRAYGGCPVPDTDHDGVPDDQDKCPTVAGLARNLGCPLADSDNDGVVDEEDKCPQVAGLARYHGCPVPDTDGDGVNDEVDKCPTVKGTGANQGCPEITEEIVQKVNFAAKRIQFQFAKSNLLPASFKILDEVTGILQENPGLKLSIEGHTSADGILEANMKLSQQRADAVKAYFEAHGIPAERLTATGFGPTKPLNNGRTEAEKAANRRVELKLSY